jgi:hypothetical protein
MTGKEIDHSSGTMGNMQYSQFSKQTDGIAWSHAPWLSNEFITTQDKLLVTGEDMRLTYITAQAVFSCFLRLLHFMQKLIQ